MAILGAPWNWDFALRSLEGELGFLAVSELGFLAVSADVEPHAEP
jgi:hypothetical protein